MKLESLWEKNQKLNQPKFSQVYIQARVVREKSDTSSKCHEFDTWDNLSDNLNLIFRDVGIGKDGMDFDRAHVIIAPVQTWVRRLST